MTALGGCIRAIGEWSAASRAIGRLDLSDIEFFSDVLSGDHVHVDPAGVQAAFITASCVEYSSAGAQAGLNRLAGGKSSIHLVCYFTLGSCYNFRGSCRAPGGGSRLTRASPLRSFSQRCEGFGILFTRRKY